MLTSYEICQLAADHIETHGWHKGTFLAIPKGENYIPGVKYPACALGACKYATGYYATLYHEEDDNVLQELSISAWAAAKVAFDASTVCDLFDTIQAYNDAPTTTKEDVIRILRNCPKD